MAQPTRRAFLGSAAAGAIAVTAGCLDELTGNGGVTTPPELEWFPADVVDASTDMMFMYLDLEVVRAEWPQEMIDDLGLDQLAAQLGVEADDFSGMLGIRAGTGLAAEEHSIFLGSFDQAAVNDHLDLDDPEEYEGYSIFEGVIYAGDDAIIVSPDGEGFIDAKQGSASRAVDETEYFAEAVADVADDEMITVMLEPDEAHELGSMGITTTSADTYDIQGHFYFADADTAEEEYEDAEEDMLEEMEDGEIDDVELDGNVVRITASGDIEDFF